MTSAAFRVIKCNDQGNSTPCFNLVQSLCFLFTIKNKFPNIFPCDAINDNIYTEIENNRDYVSNIYIGLKQDTYFRSILKC